MFSDPENNKSSIHEVSPRRMKPQQGNKSNPNKSKGLLIQTIGRFHILFKAVQCFIIIVIIIISYYHYYYYHYYNYCSTCDVKDSCRCIVIFKTYKKTLLFLKMKKYIVFFY